jgi:hypothetical protein
MNNRALQQIRVKRLANDATRMDVEGGMSIEEKAFSSINGHGGRMAPVVWFLLGRVDRG